MKGFVMSGPTGQSFERAREAEDFGLLAKLACQHAISQVKRSTAIRFHYKGGDVFRAWSESGGIVVEVPHWAAGFVIGKGGRSAKILQSLCGCPVEIRPYDDSPRLNQIKDDYRAREEAKRQRRREMRVAFARSKLQEELGEDVGELTDEEVLDLLSS